MLKLPLKASAVSGATRTEEVLASVLSGAPWTVEVLASVLSDGKGIQVITLLHKSKEVFETDSHQTHLNASQSVISKNITYPIINNHIHTVVQIYGG